MQFRSKLDDECILWWSDGGLPTNKEIEELEKEFDISLPQEFCQLLLEYGSIFLEIDEAVWPRYKGGRIWMFQYGWMIYGIGKYTPDWLNIRKFAREFWIDNPNRSNVFPFFRWVSSNDLGCFTKNGKVVYWSSDTDEIEDTKLSLSEFINQQTDELLKRKTKIKERNSKKD